MLDVSIFVRLIMLHNVHVKRNYNNNNTTIRAVFQLKLALDRVFQAHVGWCLTFSFFAKIEIGFGKQATEFIS